MQVRAADQHNREGEVQDDGARGYDCCARGEEGATTKACDVGVNDRCSAAECITPTWIQAALEGLKNLPTWYLTACWLMKTERAEVDSAVRKHNYLE